MEGARRRRLKASSCFCVWIYCVQFVLPVLSNPLPRGWNALEQPDRFSDTVDLPELVLPLADPEAFLEQHRSALGINARNVLHIAPQGFEEVDVASKGAWQVLPDGSSLWRLAIKSPGAASHVLIFSELGLPWAGEFSIYSPSETANRTQCSSSCMIVPARAKPSQKLTTLAMQGEEVLLEFHHPASNVPRSSFVVRIASIMQGLQGTLPEAAELQRQKRRHLLEKSQEVRYTPGTGFDMSLLQRKSDSVSSCTPSVLCDSKWDLINDSILDIYAVNVQLGAMALCTGTLITAPLGRKFVLTADHCFVDKKEINNFEYWILIFNYEQPCGSKTPPSIKQVIQGLRLSFYDSKADVLLLEISATIPDAFTPYKLGYDASENAVPKRAVGIHHPNGNFKRISYANNSGSISTRFTARRFPVGEVQPSAATHLQVLWSQGATASGSSGSPLIDVDTGKVVAVLTGGFASCSDPKAPDYYGRLSAAWKNGLEHFLSSAPPDGILDEVAEILTASSEGGAIVVRTMNSSASPKHGPGLGFFPHVLTFSPGERTKSFTYFLTDPIPFDNENIIMNVTVRGSIPGNMFDISPYVFLSETSDVFTPADTYSYKRSISITLFPDEPEQTHFVPGNLERFQLIFRLTSTVDPNYLHIHTLKGIAQASTGPWTQYQPYEVDCEELPCTDQYPGRNDTEQLVETFSEYNTNVTIDYNPTLAIFFFQPNISLNVQMDICLENGILVGATVSIYVNQRFTWTLSSDPFGDPNCLHIASIKVREGDNYTVVVSDQDSFDAVLPIRTVKYLYFADNEVEVVNDTAIYLGPVSGEAASSTASKAERLTLPSGSLLPASAPEQSTRLLSVTEAGAAARAPSPGAARRPAEAPGPARPPRRERGATAAAGAPTGVPPDAQQPSGAAASRATGTSGGAPALAPAPAPSAAAGKAASPYLVAWARQTDGPGPLVKAESVAPTPSAGAAGSARAAAALPPTPSPSLSAVPAVPAAVTPSAARAAPVSPVNRAAILFTGDGV